MRIEIYERATRIANYIIERETTVREAAKVFDVSKSTVHKDITERLEIIKSPLKDDVRKVLDKNKDERHIRGGESTKQKYLKMQKNH